MPTRAAQHKGEKICDRARRRQYEQELRSLEAIRPRCQRHADRCQH